MKLAGESRRRALPANLTFSAGKVPTNSVCSMRLRRGVIRVRSGFICGRRSGFLRGGRRRGRRIPVTVVRLGMTLRRTL
jgi:hypothetical protein